MNLRETSFWIRRLFPGTVRITVRGARLPGRRRAKSRPGIPVKIAEFSLYDEPVDADSVPDIVDVDGTDGGGPWFPADRARSVGDDAREPVTVPRREIASATVNFGRVDVGLRTPDGDDVRVEMFLVAYPDSLRCPDGVDSGGDPSAMARIVAGAAALIADDPEAALPTPGSVIPDAVRIGLDAAADSEVAVESTFAASGATTPHVLCVVPYVWPDGVPTITEEPDKISLHEDTAGFPDAVTGGSRLTTVTQLVPITDEEYAHADSQGVDSLMQLLAAADADLRDLRRRSVAKP